MDKTIFCVLIILLGLFIIPGGSIGETVVIDDPSPRVRQFSSSGNYFVNVIDDSITYNVSGEVITLSEFRIDVYNTNNLTEAQSFEVSGMYQDLYVHDASAEYAVFTVSNFTSFAGIFILDTAGTNLLDQSQIASNDMHSFSAKIFNTTIELYQLIDLGDSVTMKIHIFDLETQAITSTFEITYPTLSDDVRQAYFSYPMKISEEEYALRHYQTEYISGTHKEKLTAFSITYNQTSGQVSTSEFSSGICDPSFTDKSGQLRHWSFSDGCQFFVDYYQEEIYFARIMQLETEESVLHMTWEDKELNVRLNYTIDRLDPYLPVFGKDNSLQIFSFDYDEWRSENDIHYLNLKFDFNNEEIYVSEGVKEVPVYSNEFLFFYTDNLTSVTFFFPTVSSIAEIKIDNISPVLYIVPSDLYRQSQYSNQPSVNFLGYVVAIPVIVAFKDSIRKSKKIS